MAISTDWPCFPKETRSDASRPNGTASEAEARRLSGGHMASGVDDDDDKEEDKRTDTQRIALRRDETKQAAGSGEDALTGFPSPAMQLRHAPVHLATHDALTVSPSPTYRHRPRASCPAVLPTTRRTYIGSSSRHHASSCGMPTARSRAALPLVSAPIFRACLPGPSVG